VDAVGRLESLRERWWSRLSGLHRSGPAERGADDQTLLGQEGHEVGRARRLRELKRRDGLRKETREGDGFVGTAR